MAVITISRELAALGNEIAAELVKLLNYRLVDKSTLEDRIKSYGVVDHTLEKFDERKPSFWASLSQDRDDYLHYLKTAVLAEAGQGNCIIIGRGAAMLLKNVPAVLSVFLVAPQDIRVERVKSYFHCDDRRARQIIDQSDHDREGFHRYFFDAKWEEPANYHLTLNTGRQPPVVLAEIIKHLLTSSVNEETEAQNAERLAEMILGQRIKHHILYEKEVPIHFLETSVSGKKVILYGVTNSPALVEAALTTAREAITEDSGYTVESEIQAVQEFSVLH
ncbi:phospholipid-binding protein [Spirochaetia bacterium]|nr:phospholipid-binding protein [Spirochaetia bacterium]